MIKIFEVLKQNGLFSNDIRTRLKNKQLEINGEKLTSNIELDVEVDDDDNVDIIETGGFICNLIKNNNTFLLQMKIFGFENLFDSNINSELTKIFDDFFLIKISKKDSFLIRKNNGKSKI